MLLLNMHTMSSSENSDRRIARSMRVSAQHQELLSQPTTSIGHGNVCSDHFQDCTGPTGLIGSLQVRHPLAYSDVRRASSRHLRYMHERILISIEDQYWRTCTMAHDDALADEQLIARHDSWVLIDMLLHERQPGRKPEPPLFVGFDGGDRNVSD